MGLLSMFSKQKSSPALSGGLEHFLNDADAEYMRAFATKSIRQLQNFVSRECAVKISRVVFGNTNRYFGSEKFRKTEWVIQDNEDGVVTVQKSVHFDKVRIGATLNIGVASDYKECWVVDTREHRLVVLDIKAA